MKRLRILTAICVLCAFGCLLIGSILLLRANRYDALGVIDMASVQPTITVAVEEPYRNLLIFADFRTDNYGIRLVPGTFDDTGNSGAAALQELKQHGSLHVLIRVSEAGSNFAWSQVQNMSPRQIGSTGHSSPVGGESGVTDDLLFEATLNSAHPSAGFVFTPQVGQVYRKGPWIRIGLPTIDVTSFAAEQLENNQVSGSVSDIAGGALDGTIYYAPNLGIWADCSPYDEFNNSYTLQHMIPTPAYEPPISWQVHARFFPDIVYRDSDWDRRQSDLSVLAGILIGIGGAILVIPLASYHAESVSRRKESKVVRTEGHIKTVSQSTLRKKYSKRRHRRR